MGVCLHSQSRGFVCTHTPHVSIFVLYVVVVVIVIVVARTGVFLCFSFVVPVN